MPTIPITPKAGNPPIPTDVSTESTDAAPPPIFEGLPKEVQSIPLVQWLSIGKPPAVRVLPQEFYPELRPLVKNIGEVLKNGLSIYGAQAGDAVIYNPLFIGPEELQAADQQGNLAQIIPSYGELTNQQPPVLDPATMKEVEGEITDAKRQLTDMQAPPTAQPASMGAPAAPPQMPPPPGPLTASRIKGLMPGSPSSGPVPGGGRILNALLTPAR